MKHYNILNSFLVLYILSSCATKNRENIVDYNFNSVKNFNYVDLGEERNSQTIILLNKKEISLEKFNKYIREDKIKTLNILRDSLKIKELNYSPDKIKTIIIASKN